jgi:hypothetical protein
MQESARKLEIYIQHSSLSQFLHLKLFILIVLFFIKTLKFNVAFLFSFFLSLVLLCVLTNIASFSGLYCLKTNRIFQDILSDFSAGELGKRITKSHKTKIDRPRQGLD